jgi:hypothetical protein
MKFTMREGYMQKLQEDLMESEAVWETLVSSMVLHSMFVGLILCNTNYLTAWYKDFLKTW